MSNNDQFMLFDHQVPEPPETTPWVDHFRWLIFVMNPDDPALHFVASVLAYALDKGGVTSRQQKAALKILERVVRDHRAGVLECQNNAEDEVFALTDLSNMKPEGRA